MVNVVLPALLYLPVLLSHAESITLHEFLLTCAVMTAPGQLSYYSPRGTIYYTPGDLIAEVRSPARLPTPPFQARQRRPHSIHITRYPIGFQFLDPLPPKPRKDSTSLTKEFRRLFPKERTKRAFSFVLAPFTSTTSVSSAGSSTRSLSPAPSIPLPANSAVEPRTDPNARLSVGDTMASTMASRGLHNLGAASRSAINLHANDARKQASITTRPALGAKVGSGERPLASVKGVSCNIILAEPHVYLTGFDHGNHTHSSQNSTAMIRGRLILKVAKGAKIKAITLSFSGKACTEWPEG